MGEFPFHEVHFRQLYRLLQHDGHFTQVHLQAVNEVQWTPLVEKFKRKNGREPNAKEFQWLCVLDRRLLNGEEEVVKWAEENNGKGNCFIGRNPRTAAGDIDQCFTLSLDLDPDRPKGEAATEEQLQNTILAATELKQFFGYGTMAISGNGVLLLFPLREPVTKDVAERWGRALEELARGQITNGGETIIDSTFDVARLAKALGTISTKGDPALWRSARFLDTPNQDYRNYDAFIQRLQLAETGLPTQTSFTPPPVEKGEMDRSTADIALANRLKLQGFTAEDAYRALRAYSFRPEREDDYKRIIEKVYFGKGDISSMVGGGKELRLWSPGNGLAEYNNRERHEIPELPTGFGAIDDATHGLIRGHIFTVAARTNNGKTTFAITVAANLCRLSRRILFISTENQFHEIWDRYIAASTGIPAFKLQHGIMSDPDKEHYGSFITEFQQQQFFVYDGSRPNLAIITQAVEQTNPDVLVFDYFQHVEGRETKELEELVMQIKELAKQRQMAVLMCAQLHDRYNHQTGKQLTPTLADMKNCKVLNDESRVVVLLDWDRDSVRGDSAAAVKCLLAKNKGSKTDVLLKLDRSIPRFVNENQ